MPASISAMSSSLTAGSETVTFGRLRPWREATLPPTSTWVTTSAPRHLRHAQADRAVGEVEHVALVHELREAAPGHRQALGGARPPRSGVSTTLGAAAELRHAVAAHRADPQLGPRDVAEDRHLAAGALGGGADQLRPSRRARSAVAVGEVEPRHVHPGLDHLLEHVGLARGRSDGRDDLGGAHAVAQSTPRSGVAPSPRGLALVQKRTNAALTKSPLLAGGTSDPG